MKLWFRSENLKIDTQNIPKRHQCAMSKTCIAWHCTVQTKKEKNILSVDYPSKYEVSTFFHFTAKPQKTWKYTYNWCWIFFDMLIHILTRNSFLGIRRPEISNFSVVISHNSFCHLIYSYMLPVKTALSQKLHFQ